MDPVQSWLDAKEVRRMAESLMTPPPKVDPSAVDAGYGDDFEGFANTANSSESILQEQMRKPDGRPHAQPQFVHSAARQASETPESDQVVPALDETQRAQVGSALADARKLAEASGMIQNKAQPVIQPHGLGESLPEAGAETASSVQPQAEAPAVVHESPFQVCPDQEQHEADPVAQQVQQPQAPIEPQFKAQLQPQPDVIDEWSEQDNVEPVQRDPDTQPELERQTFQPDVVAQPAPDPSPPLATGIEPEPRVPVPSQAATGMARGPFLSRLQQFSFILRRDLEAKAMFLIDNDGQILLDEVENPKLIQVARTLANASYRASRQSAGAAAVGNLHVKIGANATLEVIPVESRYGLLILGAIFPAPLGAKRVMQVAGILAETVEPRR